MEEKKLKLRQLQRFLIINRQTLEQMLKTSRLQNVINKFGEELAQKMITESLDDVIMEETASYFICSYRSPYFDDIIRQDGTENNFLIIAKDSFDIYYFRSEKAPIYFTASANIPDVIYHRESLEKFSLGEAKAYKVFLCEDDYFFSQAINKMRQEYEQKNLRNEDIEKLTKKI